MMNNEKRIVVKNCEWCPFMNDDMQCNGYSYTCNLQEKSQIMIIPSQGIDSSCPLKSGPVSVEVSE
jgi:hypothetical protein